MSVTGSQRYCPSCGLESDAQFCPEDGVATVERRRLDVDASAIHAGDVIQGRYRVTGVLGRGGFGAVYAAEHTGTQQPVAIKMLLTEEGGADEDDVRRFYREARITANLSHANTVRVFDVGQTNAGALYIAMELLHGPTLEQRLRTKQKHGEVLTEREAIDIAIPVLKSLHEAHRKGLVHRDLKPANIMLTTVAIDDDEDDDEDDDVLVKVLDFGIARPQDSSLTGAGTSLGTPAYMSPEQCRSGQVEAASDLYSLGIILFRCVTGLVPFRDRNPLTVMFKHASEPPPDLHSLAKTPLSDGFVDAVLCALAKSPRDRFTSARQMRKALEAARDGVPYVPATARYQRGGDGDGDGGPDSEPITESDRIALGSGGAAAITPSSQRRAQVQSRRIHVDDADVDGATGVVSTADARELLEQAEHDAGATRVDGAKRVGATGEDTRIDAGGETRQAHVDDDAATLKSGDEAATDVWSGTGETRTVVSRDTSSEAQATVTPEAERPKKQGARRWLPAALLAAAVAGGAAFAMLGRSTEPRPAPATSAAAVQPSSPTPARVGPGRSTARTTAATAPSAVGIAPDISDVDAHGGVDAQATADAAAAHPADVRAAGTADAGAAAVIAPAANEPAAHGAQQAPSAGPAKPASPQAKKPSAAEKRHTTGAAASPKPLQRRAKKKPKKTPTKRKLRKKTVKKKTAKKKGSTRDAKKADYYID